MEQYIKTKLNDYLYELSLNNFVINSWRKLELITAYKNKSLLYEDVPEYIKEKYDLPSRDEGIDVIKLNDETIIETYQCKDYNGYVSNHALGTYFAFHLYKLKDIPFNIVGSSNSVFNSIVTPIIYDTNEIFDFKTDPKLEKNISQTLRSHQDSNILKNLRWYQKEAIQLIEESLFKNYNELTTNSEVRIKIPCGCGKTALMYYFDMYNLNILIMVPKINIAEQIQDYFENNLNKQCNCYWTDNDVDMKSNVTICVYNSVDKVLNNKYDIIFIDEAHHILGSKLYKYYDIDYKSEYNSFIPKIQNLNSVLKVYLSATIDVKNIDNIFELSFDKAIEEGYLSDYEFNILYVDSDFDKDYHQLVDIINENKEYKHIILYCNRIETANSINKLLNKNNIISHTITSEDTKSKRNNILNNFRNGLIKVLCSVNCLNEGTDLPIADTCMFVNDRGSEINIIQCIGRVLRKHKFKNKARIVLFDTNQDDGELKYVNYMRIMDKIDSNFKANIKRKLKLYDYVRGVRDAHGIKCDISKKQSLYFDKITHFRLSWEDKLKLCKEFYNEFKKIPKDNKKYKDFGIGSFIQMIRLGNDQDKINQLKEIFKEDWIEGDINEHNYKQNIELCKQFYDEFHKLPSATEKYKDFSIGQFIYRIKTKNNENKINDLKQIFKEDWIDGNIIKCDIKYTFDDKLELCKQYYAENKCFPKTTEIWNNFNIGAFIDHTKRRNNINKINQLKEIFKEHWIDGNINEHKYKQNLELCKQFYDEFHKLPLAIDEYKDFSIGSFINTIKTSRNKNKINDLKQIFGEHWIDGNINDSEFQRKLELCKQYYAENKCFPKRYEEYKKFAIGPFVTRLRNGNDQDKINQLKEIFKEHWIDGKIRDHNFKRRLELCKQYYAENKCFPKTTEIWNGFNIGAFIDNTKRENNPNKINQLEEIFGKLPRAKSINHLKNDDERFELCRKWYSIHKTIPKREDMIDNWKIGEYVNRIRRKKQHPMKSKLEEIFHCKLD